MLKRYLIIAVVLIMGLMAGVIQGGCAAEETTTRIKVVTTTSLMEQIALRVGGDMVDVVNIIPPAQCPGHFDVKPGDVQKLADADLFLMHGWQGEMFSDELIASADNPDLTTSVINAKVGENVNWMTPSVQADAVDKIAEALSGVDAANSEAYRELADEYKAEIEVKEAEILALLADKELGNVNIMCNEQLTGLVRWLGLNVVTTYGRPDSLTPQVVKDFVDTAKAEDVVLFIDNLQAGAEAAVQMAEEVGCKRIVFTNFPGGFEGTETWEKAIDYDIDILLEAISE
ncbi:metal ABC transporter substrate-binding protein [Chloroflexota bacterium]